MLGNLPEFLLLVACLCAGIGIGLWLSGRTWQ